MVSLELNTSGKVRLELPSADAVLLACNRAAVDMLVPVLKHHFSALPGRSFWADAASATRKGAVTAQHGEVLVEKRGVHLQWKGGTVKPTGKPSEVTGQPTKNLLIPVGNSALKGRTGNTTLGDLNLPKERVHVVKAKNGKRYLIADSAAAGKRKAGNKNGVMLGALVPQVTIPPHPNVLPSEGEMMQVIRTAAVQRLREMEWAKKD